MPAWLPAPPSMPETGPMQRGASTPACPAKRRRLHTPLTTLH